MKKLSLIALLFGMLFLAACAPGTERFSDPVHPAGFFWGLWHGAIAPISLIWQIFNAKIRIYEANNMGFVYDLGYCLAIMGGLGGCSIFGRK